MQGRKDEMKVWRLIQSLSTPNVVEDAGEVVITGRRRIWDSFLKESIWYYQQMFAVVD